MMIDFHVHVASFSPHIPEGFASNKLKQIRKEYASHFGELTSTLHKGQVALRYLPKMIRRPIEKIANIASPLPGLFAEATPSDLDQKIDELHLDYALVIAHPPILKNEWLLENASAHPKWLIAVRPHPETVRLSQTLQSWIKKGAKALKIHVSADKADIHSTAYTNMIKIAAQHNLPVILHTGCFEMPFSLFDASLGEASLFQKWFEKFPNVKFVLAHMNYHEPEKAIDLSEEFENVFLDTSWQPTEVIAEAVRRVGAEKVLFGSDWPLLGGNMEIGINRIRDAVDAGLIQPKDADCILGLNAAKMLNLK